MCDPVAITGPPSVPGSFPHTLPTASRRTSSPASAIQAATWSWAATHSGEYTVRQTPVSPYAPWRASSSRRRSTRPASTSIKLASERHRVRGHRRSGRPAQLHREAEERELVLLLGGDLLHVDDLDDLRARGREHVGVDGQEGVRLVPRHHLEPDRVAGDAHRARLLAQPLRSGEVDPRRLLEVAVEV